MQLLRVVFIGAIKVIISGDLLKINGRSVAGLKNYKITRAKLYSDAGRNLNGGLSATFIGVFPKLELEIGGVLTKERVSELCGLLDQGFFNVEYYDPKTGATKSGAYYASDYSVELLERQRGLYKPFTVNLIPMERI
nr:MAG TPA: hypothetical protein [Caudoviricetes sp.]